ncbi:MAG: hypothetical protein ACKOYJ_05360 [Planctomycetia bacterium]
MASRKSKKKTYSQKIVGMATVGMPTPVQQVATSRWGSKLLLILVPILLATGVITISFTGGIPSVTVNKERAAAVGREVKQEAMRAAETIRQENNWRR